MDDKAKNRPGSAADEREARLKEALRANLQRRKQKARALRGVQRADENRETDREKGDLEPPAEQ